jgi:hypothetical protein
MIFNIMETENIIPPLITEEIPGNVDAVDTSNPVKVEDNGATDAVIQQQKKLVEKILKYEARITTDSWDTEAWTQIIMEVQSKNIEVARPYYERFLQQFPTAVCFDHMFYLIYCKIGALLEILCRTRTSC